MRFEVFLKSIIFGLLIHNVFANVVSESESGDATTDNVKRDLCYIWRTNHSPFWAGPVYKELLKKEAEKFFFENGKLLPVAEIIEKCKAFPKYILDSEHIQVHYEICYYAKHGFWFAISKNEHEEKERKKLLNKYVIVGGKRINRRDVKLLCSGYEKMNCPLCKKEKEQMCHYAANGFWINNKEPDMDFQNRFFYNGESLIDWQEIWNKCTNYFKGKPFSTESVYYPPCSYTTIPTNTPTTETLPPNTPSLNTPPLPPHPSPLKTTTTNISPQDTTLPPDITLPPSTPSPTKTIPTNPPPDTPPPITIPNGGHFTDETPPLETSPENSLPLWYYPDESQSTEPKTILITAPNSTTTLTTPSTASTTIKTTTTNLPPTSMKTTTLTTPSTSSTTITTTTTNLPPTSTKSTTLTWTTKLITFTNHADCTIPTLDRTSTKPDTTTITTPTTITSTTDLTTVKGPVCPTCSHNQETFQCNEKHLHVHLHIDGNNSILTKEVLKTLKLFNGDKG